MNIERRKCHQRAVKQTIYLQGTTLEQEDTRQGPLTRNKNFTERKETNL